MTRHRRLKAYSIYLNNLCQDDAILLNGEWEFYWQQLLEPKDLQAGDSLLLTRSYGKVPAEWKQIQVNSTALPNQGYGTYSLIIQTNYLDRDKEKALYMPSVATAYKLWINGQLLAENGLVGISRDDMVPKNYPKVVFVPPGSTRIELLIQVSNFVQRKGGLWQSIRFGLAEPILYLRDREVAYEGFIAGSLFIMGLYHLGLFAVRRTNQSPLYFGLLCIVIGLRTLLLGETLAVRLFPGLDWEVAVKAEYLTSMLGLAFLMQFVGSQYPQELSKRVRHFILLCCMAGSVWIITTPAIVFTSSLFVFQLLILTSITLTICVYLLAAIQRREGSVLNGIGLFLFFAAVLNDTLYYQNLGKFENLVPFGLLCFLITQMLNLAHQFASSFTHVEKLSKELKQMNQLLEEKVKERTTALEQINLHLERVNHELSTVEKSRQLLLTNISHELGTPLTSIQGFIKAMIDGVVDKNDPKYLNLIYDKTIFLNRIIHDLYELTKLESRQISFHYRRVALKPFIQQLYDKYVVDIEKRGITFTFQNLVAPASSEFVTVAKIDPIRIEQVFVNLLMNASKFTPQGGTICLKAEISVKSASHGNARISISDTGAGIADEDLPFIFDRFYKGTESRKRKNEGVGLGLAISNEIIEYHHGKIEASSRLGEGSEFSFTLPVEFVPKAELGEVS